MRNTVELTTEQMETRIREIKDKFGNRLFIPGHHYQKDEVIQFADATGDSLKLAQLAARNHQAEYIVFCGVHFMAETADILTRPDQKVILPDLGAGCSMADMATKEQTDYAWTYFQNLFGDTILPLTYVNSTAAVKAFVGNNGGATLTSSNAKQILAWALAQKERILFLPDQHLGRNTAVDLGIKLDEMAVWNPNSKRLEYDGDINKIKIILWKGHCSVHQMFTTQHIKIQRLDDPEVKIIVHPECSYEVVKMSDINGSTSKIIETIAASPKGSKWAVGTEANLVTRIAKEFPDKHVVSLNPYHCNCSTMNRIDLEDLYRVLDKLDQGEIDNLITVDNETARGAMLSLERMLN